MPAAARANDSSCHVAAVGSNSAVAVPVSQSGAWKQLMLHHRLCWPAMTNSETHCGMWLLSIQSRVACTYDNVPADALPGKSASLVRVSQDALTSQIWVTTSTVRPTFWDSDGFNFKCHGRQLAPNRCNLGGAN